MTKILLVDDENLILFALSRSLKHGDTDVTAVTNGKDALREIQSGSYDICFLDVQLPDSNGLDLMKIIRDISPSTSIIIMTAGILTDAQQRSLRDHSCHFFPKPFDLNLMQAIVADLSSHPVAGRE
jgi:DNA-binding NtrC family response regulator